MEKLSKTTSILFLAFIVSILFSVMIFFVVSGAIKDIRAEIDEMKSPKTYLLPDAMADNSGRNE